MFEEYDQPGPRTDGGIATTPVGKAAWFKDSEGNLLTLTQLGLNAEAGPARVPRHRWPATRDRRSRGTPGGAVPRARWRAGLAHVLDDEPLTVIDQASGRGFGLTPSGGGGNFQLHTLLADW